MIKLLKVFLFIFFSSLIQVSAQSHDEEIKTFKFGKVDPEEFNIKGTGADSAAAAVKIFDVGKGYFEVNTGSGSFVYVFERHVRYKVVSKLGYDLADFEIGLYNNNKGAEENLDNIKAATYNMVNGKVEISKMTSDAKFSSRLDKNRIIKKFTLPNVKEGSVIEYTYKTKSDFMFKLDDWYFQGRYPCKYSAFTLTLPEYYRYKIAVGGYVDIRKLTPVEIRESYFIPSTNTSNAGTLNASATRNQYFAENIPAIKNESYITTLEDYVSKIGFELASTNFPQSGFKDFSSSWPKILTELMDAEKFGGFIKKTNYGKDLLNGIIKDEKDPEIKMNLIFNYVRNNIKWNNKYNYFTEATNPRTVLEKKSGNSAEINLCLLGLLKAAGIETSPVLLSTRRNGAHPGYPLASKFNNVIVQAEIAGKKHLLDATDKNNVSDLISYQNLSHQGLKLDVVGITAEWIPIESTVISRSNIMYNLKLTPDNKFTGNVFLSSTSYDGVDRRDAYQSATNEAEFIKNYKSNKTGLEISSYKIENLDQPDQPLQETMDVSIEDNVEDAGNLSYFTPMLFERTKENPFSLEERNFPVDFAHPFEENFRMVLEFPANYHLDKLPKSEAFSLPENAGIFSITYAAEGNKIAIKSKISISKPIFTAEEYFNLKELYKNIVRKQAEQIVFKKS